MNGMTWPLCGGCHTQLHKLARRVINGEFQVDDIGNPKTKFAVNEIVTQYAEYQNTGVAVDARRRIAVSFSAEELEAMHRLKVELRMKSLDGMLKALAITEARRRGLLP